MNKVALKRYEGLYEIDESGNVFSVSRIGGMGVRVKAKKLKITRTSAGREKINLSKDGVQKTEYIDNLLKENF